MLKRCIDKINEVALDLREPQAGANLEHQAQKLDRVADELRQIRGDDNNTDVHGGGTGKE